MAMIAASLRIPLTELIVVKKWRCRLTNHDVRILQDRPLNFKGLEQAVAWSDRNNLNPISL